MNVAFRYLKPNEKIYIITKHDEKYPLNFGLKRYYTIPFKDKNVIIGFHKPNLCDKAMKALNFQRLKKVEVDINYLMKLSDTLNMESMVLMTELDSNPIDLFYYKNRNN